MVKVAECSKFKSQIAGMLGDVSKGEDEKFHQICPECNLHKTTPIVKMEESDSYYKWLDFIDENK
jgi:hypothetical protein